MDGKVDEIANEQFDKQWESEILGHREIWSHQKSLFTVGQKINAKVLYHRPQGYIVDIGNALGRVKGLDFNCKIGDKI